MKKTYWWRLGIVGVAMILFGISYVLKNQELFGICGRVYSTETYVGCLDKGALSIGKPLFLYALFLLSVSPFLFFVRDKVFLCWLRFALVWSVLTVIFVALVPVSQGGWLGIGPEKWSITMVMGWIFLIGSILLLVWKSQSKA